MAWKKAAEQRKTAAAELRFFALRLKVTVRREPTCASPRMAECEQAGGSLRLYTPAFCRLGLAMILAASCGAWQEDRKLSKVHFRIMLPPTSIPETPVAKLIEVDSKRVYLAHEDRFCRPMLAVS